jgi:transcriptional regulator with XRE-family HTH domain
VDQLPTIFGRVMRARREAADLSQEALAAATGLSKNYIGMLERGERNATLEVVRRLARALGTTMTSLVSATERKLPTK